MTKTEILKYSRLMCEHGHPMISHPACLSKAVHFEERVGYLDIETSNFNAAFGIVVSWCIKEDGGRIYEGVLSKADFEDKQGYYDKRIIQSCIDTMRGFDRIVVYWGTNKRFDIPFLRTRAAMMGVDFPFFQELIVNDLYDIVKNKFKFGRNSLAAACLGLGISAKETPIYPELWVKSIVGRDKKAIAHILQHNREDVISTEKLWHRIMNFANTPKSSI